jgi:ABC-2 type transport system permease protein
VEEVCTRVAIIRKGRSVVVLTFASRFGAQLLTALVAGDIVASEDSGGTLKTILTRSLVRGQILACKVLATLAYIVAILVALAIAGIIGGTIAWGFNPLTTFSGTRISALHAFALTFAALGVFALPLLGVAAFAIFLSVATWNSAAAIVGSVVYAVAQEAIGGLVHVPTLHRYLLSTQFDSWQGVFHTPTDWTVVGRAIWVSALYVAVPLVAAHLIFGRRDVAGP